MCSACDQTVDPVFYICLHDKYPRKKTLIQSQKHHRQICFFFWNSVRIQFFCTHLQNTKKYKWVKLKGNPQGQKKKPKTACVEMTLKRLRVAYKGRHWRSTSTTVGVWCDRGWHSLRKSLTFCWLCTTVLLSLTTLLYLSQPVQYQHCRNPNWQFLHTRELTASVVVKLCQISDFWHLRR